MPRKVNQTIRALAPRTRVKRVGERRLMKKLQKPKTSFACFVYLREEKGKWNRIREIKTEQGAENYWRKMK